MQTERIVLSLAIAIGGLGAAAPALSQEYRGTWEQQMACTPDVMRLCSEFVPDADRIVVCLKAKRRQLSPSCLGALQPAGSKSTSKSKRKHART